MVDTLRTVAAQHDRPMAQVALAWLLNKPGVTAPIVGATKMAHIDDAIRAVEITMSDEDMERLEAPYRPHGILGHA